MTDVFGQEVHEVIVENEVTWIRSLVAFIDILDLACGNKFSAASVVDGLPEFNSGSTVGGGKVNIAAVFEIPHCPATAAAVDIMHHRGVSFGAIGGLPDFHTIGAIVRREQQDIVVGVSGCAVGVDKEVVRVGTAGIRIDIFNHHSYGTVGSHVKLCAVAAILCGKVECVLKYRVVGSPDQGILAGITYRACRTTVRVPENCLIFIRRCEKYEFHGSVVKDKGRIGTGQRLISGNRAKGRTVRCGEQSRLTEGISHKVKFVIGLDQFSNIADTAYHTAAVCIDDTQTTPYLKEQFCADNG